MPILKQLVSGSSQAKRRSRADLTAEMISAPLGDFRHTMHVGRGGDTFGDTSFLSSRSGEPPRQAPDVHHQSHSSLPQTAHEELQPEASPTHKPSLLSRTFRSSKRSQSVNRPDKHKAASTILTVSGAAPGSGGSSPTHVKSAISLPYLNDASGSNGNSGGLLPKSVSSSPIKKYSDGTDGDVLDSRRPINGGVIALATQEPDLLDQERERRFGELRELPPSLPRGGGMKHAESIMSFHIDLGPSMLGDILSVMDKSAWGVEDDDLGYEEGRPSPPTSPPEDRDLQQDNNQKGAPSPAAPSRPARSTATSFPPAGRLAGGGGSGVDSRLPSKLQQQLDSCSVSSSGSSSTVQEDKLSVSSGLRGHHSYNHHHQVPQQHYNHSQSQSETDGDSARFSSPGRTRNDEQDFSFMDDDEDEDEIRV